MTKEQKQSDALDRLQSDALYGIESNDHEIMNKPNYGKEINQHYKDVETIRTALTEHAALKAENARLREIAKAVSHVGVDCGYGVYELQPDTIALARKLCEEQALKGQDKKKEGS